MFVATVLRYLISPVLPPGLPFVTYFPSVVLIGVFCGALLGAVSTLLLGLAGIVLFSIPEGLGSLGLYAWGYAFFVIVSGIGVVSVDAMHHAVRRAEIAREEAARHAAARDLMFSELQHRVSNNLAVIAGYLAAQRRRLTDPAARDALEEANARIKTVAQLQRLLHDPSQQRIKVSCFVAQAAAEMLSTAGASKKIGLSVAGAPVEVDARDAVPLGLIATEMIANAIEHGFGEGGSGDIIITVEAAGPGRGRLRVRDGGKGLWQGFDLSAASGLGMTVAAGFAQQLEGRIDLQNAEGGGAVATIEFRAITPGMVDAPAASDKTATAQTVSGPGRAAVDVTA
jgi:two-component sensor histidine kinase